MRQMLAGVYRAVMVDLVPDSLYSYRVQTGDHYSRDFTFRHINDQANRTSSFLVYGDLGKVGGEYTV